MKSPLALEPLFHIGPALITEPVVVAWGVIALLAGGAALSTRRLSLTPSKTQATVEILVSAIDDQIGERCSAIQRRFAPLSARFPVRADLELVVARSRRRAADRAY